MMIEIQRHENWLEVVLNHPETRNAITGPLGVQLATSINEANADENVQVILLRGAGGAFCSGLNLKEFNAEPPPTWLADFQTIWRRAHSALYECEKPIIVALEKYAINGGAALALAADLLIVGTDSYLQVGEVQLGMAAPYNIAWLSLRHSEVAIAQLALTGRRYSGAELHRLGIAYSAPDTSNTLAEAQALAERLANYPPDSLKNIKYLMRAYHDVPATEWFDRATTNLPQTRARPDRVPRG